MALNNFVKSIRNIMRNDAGINGDSQRIEQIAWMLFLKVYDEKENDWEFNEENYTSFIPENCRWRSWAKDEGDGEALTADALLDFVNNTLFPTLKNLEVTPLTPVRSSIVRTTFQDANQYMKDGVLLRQVINVIDGLDLGDYEEHHAFGVIYETILKEMQSAGSAGEFYTPRALTDFMAYIIDPKVGDKMADFACGTGGFITSWLNELDKKVITAEDREEYSKSIYGIEKKQFPHILCVTNLLLHDIDSPMVYHDNSLTKDVLNYTEDEKFDVILMNPPYGGSEKNEIKQHFPSDLSSSETADLFMVLIMYRLKKGGRAAVILPDGFLFGADKKSAVENDNGECQNQLRYAHKCGVFHSFKKRRSRESYHGTHGKIHNPKGEQNRECKTYDAVSLFFIFVFLFLFFGNEFITCLLDCRRKTFFKTLCIDGIVNNERD